MMRIFSALVIGFWTAGIKAEVEVIDDFERQIILAEPAQRIISLAPHNTENLFSAGAGDKVVGVVEYSDYPNDAQSIQSVGSYSQFNLEMILALKPDLIVAWQNASNRESLLRLEKLGFAIYYSEPRSFVDIVDNILELSILSGTRNSVDPRVDRIVSELNQMKNRYRDVEQLDVFYQVWTDPLMTLNGEHFISRVLELCGARNIFSDLPIIAPRVSVEAVVQANPDVIATGMVDGVAPDMSLWQDWNVISAVEKGNYVFVESNVMHRHTLRMLTGIPEFCANLDSVRHRSP